MLHIFTASRIDCPERLHTLVWASESLQECLADVKVHHWISVADASSRQMRELDQLLQNSSCYTYTLLCPEEARATQLEQLQYIAYKADLPDEACVMFFDDDIMVSTPPDLHRLLKGEVSGIVGYHYIPLVDSQPDALQAKNRADVLAYIQKRGSMWDKESDFSGYCCSYGTVRPALTGEVELTDTFFGDLKVMKSIDNANPVVPMDPFVFHRLWDSPEEQSWRSSLSQFIQDQDMRITSLTERLNAQ